MFWNHKKPKTYGIAIDLSPGDNHYRAYVGPPKDYDLVSAMVFNLLTCLGLRQHHRVLDIGCGSLRSGRLLIPYLNKGNYFGNRQTPEKYRRQYCVAVDTCGPGKTLGRTGGRHFCPIDRCAGWATASRIGNT